MRLIVCDADGGSARFSKYSGSLEWRNAIVLWVIVGGSDYRNLFFPDAATDGTKTLPPSAQL